MREKLEQLANEPIGLEKKILDQYARMKDRNEYKGYTGDLLELATKIVTTEHLAEELDTIRKNLAGIENSIGYI